MIIQWVGEISFYSALGWRFFLGSWRRALKRNPSSSRISRIIAAVGLTTATVVVGYLVTLMLLAFQVLVLGSLELPRGLIIINFIIGANWGGMTMVGLIGEELGRLRGG